MDFTERQLQLILDRNKRVEADKAWELSWTRTLLIAAMIYVTASVFLLSLEISSYLLQALIPSGGWILTTTSMPWMKRWWLAKRNLRAQD